MTQTPDSTKQGKLFEVSDQKTIEKLIKIGTALSVERNLPKLLNTIIGELKFVVAADKASLFLIDKERFELIFFITSDISLKEMRLPLSRKSIAGFVALTGEILRIDDVYLIPSDSPYKFNKDIDKQTGYRTKSMLALPMIDHKNEIIGVIQLINKTVKEEIVPFDTEDESLLFAIASQAAVSIENTRLYHEIEQFFESFVRGLAMAIEARDPVTKGHSRRVRMYSVAIARAMGTFSEEEIRELSYSAWLHDVGKIGVPEYILKKSNRLSDDQIQAVRERFQLIRAMKQSQTYLDICQMRCGPGENPENLKKAQNDKEKALEAELALLAESMAFLEKINGTGFLGDEDLQKLNDIAARTFIDAEGKKRSFLTAEEYEFLAVRKGNLTSRERDDMNAHVQHTKLILDKIRFTKDLKDVPTYASLHHEKLDGTGYPWGYPADKIPVQARILALADIYDALTAQDRPYKKPIPQGKSLDILEEMVQSGHLDREVFITFIKNRIYEMKDEFDTVEKGGDISFVEGIVKREEANAALQAAE
ncbi:MAG: HD domain-containing phosphohydrolase [Candidatus Eremiobacteraeota bacterium]|nr:HD domain-containing phosphohydrolase [Candidatus Eremiobacteraeota bacterium]